MIQDYFNLGLTAPEITSFLLCVHGIQISLRHSKRVLKRLGCTRCQNRSDLCKIVNAVERELRGSGGLLGCRAMHQRLVNHHRLVTTREVVCHILRIFDPEGVQVQLRHRLRRRVYQCKGPNYLWHVDGYDKLKPFGFCIHRAVGGFSQRILWLEVASSSNDPRIVAQYYLDCVRQLGGTAYIVQGDRGTENGSLAAIQHFFCRSAEDLTGEKSFMFGKSTSNQRIEAWWGRLRQGCAEWWIQFLKDLRDPGLYNNDDVTQHECLKFCFIDVLQMELHRVAQEWNLYRIRPSNNGKPDILYFVPETVDAQDYSCPFEIDEFEIAEEMCAERPQKKGCSPHFKELVEMIQEDEGLETPTTAEEALKLYLIYWSTLTPYTPEHRITLFYQITCSISLSENLSTTSKT